MKSIKKLIPFIILFLPILLFAQSLEELNRAKQSYQKEEWLNALKYYNEIVIHNPDNGEYWFKLGEIHSKLKDYPASVGAYKKSIEIGYNIADASYNIACNYSLLYKDKSSVVWLKSAVKSGLGNREISFMSDSNLDNIRSNESFKKLIGPEIAKDITRNEGWRTDFSYMKKQFESTHYRLYDYVSEGKWNKSWEKLVASINDIQDHQIIVELMKIAALTKAGHSRSGIPFSGQYQFHQLPIELYNFSDGIYIRKAKTAYKDIIGVKVVSIQGVPIELALQRIESICNQENKFIKNFMGLFLLTLPEVLHSFKLIDDMKQISIQFQNESGQIISKEISSEMISPEVLMSSITPNGWASLNELMTSDKPLYLKNPDAKFWFEYQNDSKIVYCQLNEINDEEKQSLKKFGQSLVDFIQKNDVKALVLDIRQNMGGNGLLNRDFLVQLIQCEKINSQGKLFTIVGRKTFSAAMLLAALLDQFTETIFVGEPTGGKPSHVGDDNLILLPYSGLKASAAMSYWQSPVNYDTRKWIAPEIFCELTSDDYRMNNDPCIDYIIENVKYH